MRIVRDDPAPKPQRCRGDYTIRHRQVSLGASEESSLPRQAGIQRHDLESRVLEGPHLGLCLGSAGVSANGICYFRDDDGGKDTPPIPAKHCQFRPGPCPNSFVVRPVVGQEERGVQDFFQLSSSLDSCRVFNRRARVVVFAR
jgi:hypothetical protein